MIQDISANISNVAAPNGRATASKPSGNASHNPNETTNRLAMNSQDAPDKVSNFSSASSPC